MPDLNLESRAALDEMIGAMRFWLARGVDGFRLDAVRHLSESPDGILVDQPGSHRTLQTVRRELEVEFPQALFVGEAWTDTDTIAAYAGRGDELHMAFSFGTAGAVMEAVRDGLRAPLAQGLARAEAAFSDRSFEAPFLTNHDMRRAMRIFDGDLAKARLAAATLLALPGTPFVYYGEEIGMQGGPSPADEDKRTPMRFDASASGGFTSGTPWRTAAEAPGVDVTSQKATPDGLWRTYQQLIALRHAHPALSTGSAVRPTVEGGGRGAFALMRAEGASRVVFVANLHGEAAPPLTVGVQAAGAPQLLLAAPGAVPALEAKGGALVVTGLGPRAWAFVRLP
jgi:alpha-amylase